MQRVPPSPKNFTRFVSRMKNNNTTHIYPKSAAMNSASIECQVHTKLTKTEQKENRNKSETTVRPHTHTHTQNIRQNADIF